MKLMHILSLLSLVTITSNSISIPTGPLYYECNTYREKLATHRQEEERINKDIAYFQDQLSHHEPHCTRLPGKRSCVLCSSYEPKIEQLMGQHNAHHIIAKTLAALLKHKELGHDVTISVRCLTCPPNTNIEHDHLPRVSTTITTTTSCRPRPRPWYYRPFYWRR